MTGILTSFIEKRIAEYKPPTKKGTPKGDPVGFPSKKYAAALWDLTYLTKKEISEKLGIDYGVLRVWRTQESFKKMYQKNAKDFTKLFIQTIKEKSDTLTKDIDNFVKIAATGIFNKNSREFDDIEIYSQYLVDNILDSVLMEEYRSLLYKKYKAVIRVKDFDSISSYDELEKVFSLFTDIFFLLAVTEVLFDLSCAFKITKETIEHVTEIYLDINANLVSPIVDAYLRVNLNEIANINPIITMRIKLAYNHLEKHMDNVELIMQEARSRR